MASIRLSPDVEALAQQVAQAKGLDGARAAVEAIVRCHWADYVGCSAQVSQVLPATLPTSAAPDIDGFSALDSVL